MMNKAEKTFNKMSEMSDTAKTVSGVGTLAAGIGIGVLGMKHKKAIGKTLSNLKNRWKKPPVKTETIKTEIRTKSNAADVVKKPPTKTYVDPSYAKAEKDIANAKINKIQKLINKNKVNWDK